MEIVNCQIHGLVSQGFFLSEKSPDGYTWSGSETDEKTNGLKARQCMARNVETYV